MIIFSFIVWFSLCPSYIVISLHYVSLCLLSINCFPHKAPARICDENVVVFVLLEQEANFGLGLTQK